MMPYTLFLVQHQIFNLTQIENYVWRIWQARIAFDVESFKIVCEQLLRLWLPKVSSTRSTSSMFGTLQTLQIDKTR
jgi:hypothetical protein